MSISSTKEISGTYDGKMALHDGSGSGDFGVDCNAAGTKNQGTTKPLFELDDGATIQNVIIDHHAADGIHCKGTCTIKNVWFRYVCDDAVTAETGSSGTVTISGGGAQGAHDKLFQDNSHGKFVIQNFYGQRLGKMYRACGVGSGCSGTKGNVSISNSYAIGVDEVVGVTSGRDTVSDLQALHLPDADRLPALRLERQRARHRRRRQHDLQVRLVRRPGDAERLDRHRVHDGQRLPQLSEGDELDGGGDLLHLRPARLREAVRGGRLRHQAMQLLGHRRLQLRRVQRPVARASQVGPRSFQGDLGARLHRVEGGRLQHRMELVHQRVAGLRLRLQARHAPDGGHRLGLRQPLVLSPSSSRRTFMIKQHALWTAVGIWLAIGAGCATPSSDGSGSGGDGQGGASSATGGATGTGGGLGTGGASSGTGGSSSTGTGGVPTGTGGSPTTGTGGSSSTATGGATGTGGSTTGTGGSGTGLAGASGKGGATGTGGTTTGSGGTTTATGGAGGKGTGGSDWRRDWNDGGNRRQRNRRHGDRRQRDRRGGRRERPV